MLVGARARSPGMPSWHGHSSNPSCMCSNMHLPCPASLTFTSLHYRYHVFGFHPRNPAWWGGLSYTIGAVQYNIAATTGLADNFPRVYAAWSANTYKWASTVMYTWGGGFFLISGICYVVLDMGISGLWLGVQVLHACVDAICTPSSCFTRDKLILQPSSRFRLCISTEPASCLYWQRFCDVSWFMLPFQL